MSIRVMTWLWENSPAAGTELLVLLAIADNADDQGGNAWPSIATLARKCRVSERSVQRALRGLEQAEMLEVHRAAGRGGTHLFRVDMTKGRQLVTPDDLSPRQPVTGDTHVTGGVTQVSPEPSLNRPPTPQPPASGGPDVHCTKHIRHRKTCPDCTAAVQASKAKPAWCHECDPDTRLVELEDDRMARCPNCHPNTPRKAAAS